MRFILLGILTILPQTVFIREMLIRLQGNEIVYAVFLSLWLGLVALGAISARLRIFERLHRQVDLLMLLLILVILLQYILIEPVSHWLEPLSGEMIRIPQLILTALIVLFPVCFVDGLLFPLLCHHNSVKRGYLLESLGIAIGGVLFLPGIQLLPQDILLVAIVTLCGFLLPFRRRWLIWIFLLIAAVGSLFLARSIQHGRYAPAKWIESRDSAYGRLDVTEENGQQNFYIDGQIGGSTGDDLRAEEIAGFCLLQHPGPKNTLYIGNMFSGMPERLPGHVDCVDVNPILLRRLGVCETIRRDPIRFLRETDRKYDLILVNQPDPVTLNLNRFYTLEFFRLLNSRLRDSLSCAIVTLQNGENAMTPSQRVLNRSIDATFAKAFPGYVIIPAAQNLFVGSNGHYISNRLDTLEARLHPGGYFNDALLFSRLNSLRMEQFTIFEPGGNINTIVHPIAFFNGILSWLRKLSPNWPNLYRSAAIPVFAVGILLLPTLILLRKREKFILGTGILLTSLIAFVTQIVLMYLMQAHYGTLYLYIVVFTSSFMIGFAIGFLMPSKGRLSRDALVVILLQLVLLITLSLRLPVVVYLLLNTMIAFLEARLLLILLNRVRSASIFYHLDSLGAMLGGIVAGIILIPITGFQITIGFCMVLTLMIALIGLFEL